MRDKNLIIDGSSYKGKASNEFIVGTWWNHEIVKAKAQISGISGRIIDQMEAAGVVPDREGNYWHSINNLDTCTLKWEDIEGKGLWAMPSEFDGLSLSLLLYGFFEFYASRFPFGTRAVSIKRANVSLSKLAAKKVNSFLSIEDPFETYDSYCPHDLGSPANDYGSAKMMT